MKFRVFKNESLVPNDYDVRLPDSTSKAVRKTAQWTAVTASVIGLAVLSDRIKKNHKNSETPSE